MPPSGGARAPGIRGPQRTGPRFAKDGRTLAVRNHQHDRYIIQQASPLKPNANPTHNLSAPPTHGGMEPGSASSAPYRGSPACKQRYEYSETSRAGFAELIPACRMTGQELFKTLSTVGGVRAVHWANPKSGEGHYMERNVLVYPTMVRSGSAKRPRSSRSPVTST